jgi:asparagine synthase (glutamine-hydrolysing)
MAMNAGWTLVSRGNEVELRLGGTQGESAGRPALVSFARSGSSFAVLMGRLYYRREKLDEVSELVTAHERENDAALGLAMYGRFGESAFERLEGDYALAIWDGTARRILAARDPLGGYPLFWTRRAGGFVLANRLRPVIDALPIRALDRDYLADFLMLPGQVQELDTDRTAYQGVQRVRAGHFVRVDTAAGRAETVRYWDWVQKIIDPGTDAFERVADGYGDRLRAAVAERARGRVAAHLSGGMDSTTTALLADACVETGAGRAPLHTITLVHKSMPGLTGEGPYIAAAEARLRHAATHHIPADQLLDFDSFTTTPAHDEPYAGLWRIGLDRSTVDAAAACGADTLLTGIGADEMLMMSPWHLLGLCRKGRFTEAWSEVRHWCRVDNCSPWTLVKPYVLDNLLPASMRGGLSVALAGGHADWRHQGEWTIAPWLCRDFARRYDLRGRSIAFARTLHAPRRPLSLSFGLYLIASRLGDVDRWSLATPHGMTIAHPFLDTRVLRYGLGMGLRLRPRPEGQKPVLAHAMRDVLPPEITGRRSKGNYSKVSYLGLSRHVPVLEDLVHATRLEDLGLVRKDVLLDCLNQAALGVTSGIDGMHRLNLTLALARWLEMEGSAAQSAEAPRNGAFADAYLA